MTAGPVRTDHPTGPRDARSTPARIGDPAFHDAVERLRVPGMGTEVAAPLLADLVRFVRPRRVLEVGMGYTTPFLAAALAETAERTRAESAALAAKTRRHLDSRPQLDDAWLLADPALVTPAFHREPYRPWLLAVDNLSIEDSSAGQVREVLAELGLSHMVGVLNADLRESLDLLPESHTPIDFAWVDAWECLYFFDHFWEHINPDGGLVVLHYLLTYPEGEALLRYITEFQRAHPGELEVMSLLEPHKLTQNSITALRRTSGIPKRSYTRGGSVRYDDRLHQDATEHERAAGR